MKKQNPMLAQTMALTSDNAALYRKRILIGLHGPAGAGKDTVGDYLKNSWQFARISFAGPLKDACSSLFGVPRLDFEDPEEKERVVRHWGKSPRWMAQWLGTEVMRDQFDTDFFLNRMDMTLKDAPLRVVVTDVRYDNEAEFIKKHGGVVWKIEGRATALGSSAKNHRSESGIDPSHIVASIDNSGSLRTTFEEVDNHLHDLKYF